MNKCFYTCLLISFLFLFAGCIQEDEKEGCDDVLSFKVDWSGMVSARPEGSWLVFYPEDKSLKTFYREVVGDELSDPLPNQNYRVLLLSMDMHIKHVDFLEMSELERATIAVQKPSGDTHYADIEPIYSSITEVKRFKMKGNSVLMLKPKLQSMRVNFEMNCLDVKNAHAHFSGIPIMSHVLNETVVYGNELDYLGLYATTRSDTIFLSGSILLPKKPVIGSRGEQEVLLELEIFVTYNDETTETIKVDITEVIHSIVSNGEESLNEVVLKLEKIGATAIVVQWKDGSGNGNVIVK